MPRPGGVTSGEIPCDDLHPCSIALFTDSTATDLLDAELVEIDFAVTTVNCPVLTGSPVTGVGATNVFRIMRGWLGVTCRSPRLLNLRFTAGTSPRGEQAFVEGRTDYAIQVPKLASLILAHDWDAELKGLNEFPNAHPPVAPVFWSFRVMVGMGMLMLAVSWWAAFSMWRRGVPSVLQLRVLAAMTFSGWVATLAGWYVTEIGRQPFLVYGVLRTADLVAPHAPGMVLSTLVAYLLVYVLLLAAYVLVLMYMARHPAMPTPEAPQSPKAATPIRGPA